MDKTGDALTESGEAANFWCTVMIEVDWITRTHITLHLRFGLFGNWFARLTAEASVKVFPIRSCHLLRNTKHETGL